jgi:hypothetical protein
MLDAVFAAMLVLAAPAPSGTDAAMLAWMSGRWAGNQGGTAMEEMWTPPAGGTLLGVHRDVRDGKTVSFEFLRIEAAADGITYWGSPQGAPATPFRMIESTKNRVVFENPKHDFPTRILYWLEEPAGTLHARIEGVMNGKAASEEWAWQRMP